ncbi:hypothetical protein [Endozoicomonas sp. ONNA2]|uniref:hypothetical protein n=1 Tax=Endozoicomonas sp. ONNA2 TaxID=2828741 RepID=UPI0021478823|nr:hypothetical protein [Endozoicomonas sp. ONNA2]
MPDMPVSPPSPPSSSTIADQQEELANQQVKALSWGYRLTTATTYAANSMLLPALMNTPITTSLARPLMQSQYDSKLPELRLMFSSRGWLPALGRTGIRYIIADTARMASERTINRLANIHETDTPKTNPPKEKINLLVDAASSAMMTCVSQPMTSLQVYRQVQQNKSALGPRHFLQGLLAHPVRGSASNFLSTFLMFNLDRNDRHLIARHQAGEISGTQMTVIQASLGGLVGVLNNFLKTHANARALGLSHQEIFQKIMIKQTPLVLAAQVLYAWVLGSVANKLWASSISALQCLDKSAHDCKNR